MNYKIWNKIDKINGVDAEHFINNLAIRETDGVFLIVDDNDNVSAVEIDRIIKNVYKLDSSLTTDEVAQEYIRIKKEEELLAMEERLTIEELQEEVAILSYEIMMNIETNRKATNATKRGEYSSSFKKVKTWFNKGFWDKEMVNNAAIKGVITKEEVDKIIF